MDRRRIDRDVAKELREAGVPDDVVPELAELARKLKGVSDVEPRRGWLLESKWRLLRRFDEAHGAPSAESTSRAD